MICKWDQQKLYYTLMMNHSTSSLGDWQYPNQIGYKFSFTGIYGVRYETPLILGRPCKLFKLMTLKNTYWNNPNFLSLLLSLIEIYLIT